LTTRLFVEEAIAKQIQMLRKTESPPERVALDLWDDRLVMGSIILLLEKTPKMYLFKK
tara:strand:- start:528 stop:701 length:174 start_codon:yes stop_codon:yes gene_type:complete